MAGRVRGASDVKAKPYTPAFSQSILDPHTHKKVHEGLDKNSLGLA
jgi:hypothetical protein